MSNDRSSRDDLESAFRELRLLVTRQPYEVKPWRDFWIVLIPTLTLYIIAFFALDPPLVSLTMLALIATTAVLVRLLYRAFAWAGWVTPRPRS